MAVHQDWQPDVVGPLVGGVDAGLDPELINNTQVAFARNISIRRGRAHSRPRVIKRWSLPAGKIQGAEAFKSRDLLMIGLGGRVYEGDPGTYTLTEKTSDLDCNNPNRPRMYMCETQDSIAIQDGQSAPIIYDGDTFRRSKMDTDPDAPELPVGWQMSYSNGRLCVVVDNQKAVRIGDEKLEPHQSEFIFTETDMLNGGGDFFFPTIVKSLNVLPVINTASGQGSTIVGCRERVSSLKTNVTARDLWDDIGFENECFPDSGIMGHRAACAVNQDLYFRSGDGLRSLRSAQADYDTPGLAPVSREMGYRFDHDAGALLEDAIVVKFDNRLLCTHSPIIYGNRSIALGLIAYNLDPMSTGGQKAPPVFDGEWDLGVQIAEIVAASFRGTERCFIVGRDASGNGVWELLREADSVGGLTDSPIQELTTRTLAGAGINVRKAIVRCDAWLSDISGPISLDFYYRTDKYPFWVLWDHHDILADKNAIWATNRPLYRKIATRTPPEVFDARTGDFLHHGFGMQVRVVWTGNARLNTLQLFSRQLSEPGVADNSEPTDTTQYGAAPSGQVFRDFWYNFSASPLP